MLLKKTLKFFHLFFKLSFSNLPKTILDFLQTLLSCIYLTYNKYINLQFYI